MLEIAAADEITYQTVVDAMDVAVAVGWGRVGYVDPASLSVRFVE
jgi:biopolymer transport protein ExbD